MTAHDEIVTALLSVLAPLGGELRLLSRLADPLIGNDVDDVFFFVPDLHLVTDERQKDYASYGFNYRQEGLLAKLLGALVPVRKKWKVTGARNLVTVQLGDFFDLWREIRGGRTIADISDDALGDLRDVLYRGVQVGLPCLQATMLLGNHDTHDGDVLRGLPVQLKAFNRSPGGKPFLFATHGDCFDLLEILMPDPIAEFGVQFLGKLTPTSKYSVGDFARAAVKINKPLFLLNGFIVAPKHELVGGAVKVLSGGALPARAVTVVSPDSTDRRFKDYYAALGLAGPDAENVRVVAAGHTHRAGLLLCEPQGGRPLLLMDVGAWVERCSYRLSETGAVVDEPSAQLGVIHGNDARIYQVRLP